MNNYDAFEDNLNNDYSIPPRSGHDRKKRSAAAALICVGAAALLALSIWVLASTFTPVGTALNFTLCRKDAVSLDLTNTRITSLKGVWNCKDVLFIDARGLELDADEVMTARERLPGCDIAWSVTIGGEQFDSDETVNLTLPAETTADELRLLTSFESLASVDATACPSSLGDALAKLQRSMPDCTILWNITIGDTTFRSTDSSITLGSVSSGDLSKLAEFPALESVDASACKLYDELVDASTQLPECSILWTVDVYELAIKSTDETVNLERTKISDIEPLIAALNYLPNAKKIDMCGCGFTNVQMEELCARLPEYKLVWEVTFGDKDSSHWTVRTDAVAFSTLNTSGGTSYDEDDFAPLFKYCTDLVAIDLGHNQIRDISAITNLQKLRIVILADNYITDMSPLVDLPNLEYLEIFTNYIRDASPLGKMPKLKDANIGNNYIENYDFMFSLPQGIGKLWASMNYMRIPSADRNKAQQLYPNCLFDYDSDDPCATIWCDDRWAAVKNLLNNWSKCVAFNDWGDYTFAEGASVKTYTAKKAAVRYAEEYTGRW